MDEAAIIVERLDGDLLLLRLNRPARRNAIDGAMLDAIEDALDRIGQEGYARGLIVAGTGQAFSAGADLKEGLRDPLVRVARMHRLVLRLAALPVVSVAAIDGPALGGGLELAMACTFRVATPGARLGLPEIGMGVIPAYGGTQLLARLVGAGRALDMILSGEPIDAQAAHMIGLVDRLAEGPGSAVSAASALARRYAGREPAAIAAALRAVRAGQGLPLTQALAEEYAAVAALIERRQP